MDDYRYRFSINIMCFSSFRPYFNYCSNFLELWKLNLVERKLDSLLKSTREKYTNFHSKANQSRTKPRIQKTKPNLENKKDQQSTNIVKHAIIP